MHKYIDSELLKSKKKTWRRSLFVLVLLFFLCINIAGLIIGSIIYEETSTLPAYSQALASQRLQKSLIYDGVELPKENVVIESPNGYSLSGTFIANPEPTTKTIIFLHGFMANRTVGFNYLNLYIKQYNKCL